MGPASRAVLIVPVLAACGRAGFEPRPATEDAVIDVSIDGVSDAPCATPGPSCWDVSGGFTTSTSPLDPTQLGVFGAPVVDGQTIYALLDGSEDDTYTTINPYDCPPFYTGAIRARAWDIERKRVDAATYHLLVRGQAGPDCSSGQQPISAGRIDLNPMRGWTITSTRICSAMTDNNSNGTVIPTHCTVDPAAGTISWQAGSGCGGCCACADGAWVDIEVTVTRTAAAP